MNAAVFASLSVQTRTSADDYLTAAHRHASRPSVAALDGLKKLLGPNGFYQSEKPGTLGGNRSLRIYGAP
jgi:hypothetical protein